MSTTSRLTVPSASLPEGPDVELRDAGVEWDAVRVPASLGDRVIASLRGRLGAVVHDPYAHLLYFFVSPGTADDWRFPEQARVRVLGKGSCVVIPPTGCDRSADVLWARPVVHGRLLTGPRRLHAAMQAVVAEGVSP